MDSAGERDLDVIAGQLTAQLLERAHLISPEELPGAIAAAALPLGVTAARIYLADLQQRMLRPVAGDGTSRPLAIEATMAGRAYRTVSVLDSPAEDGSGWRVWLPLIGGIDRLGVLELDCGDVSEPMRARYRMIASLAGLLVAGKSAFSDALAAGRRSGPMALQAELVWGYLVPRTFATSQVLVAAMLEPAYQVGGDAFDYSLAGDCLHVSVFDGAGHDLEAGLIASVGMASCRCTRRAGQTLAQTAADANDAIARHFGDTRFLTALLGELDVVTGQFSWVSCGHPPPLLIREGKVVKELVRTPRLPLGLAGLDSIAVRGRRPPGGPPRDNGAAVHTERLQPRDRLLLYTDGITDGRSAAGTQFGLDRLADYVIRHSNAGISAHETLRRLNHEIVAFQNEKLSDDATIVLVEWLPDRPEDMLTSLG